MTDLNLSGWIERRRSDVGPYAEPIIKGVAEYEAEIKRLRASVNELSAALEAADEKYEAYAVRGDGI